MDGLGMNKIERLQTAREEIVNSLTHGFGMALSSGGVGVLIALAALFGEARHIIACSIYGGTLVFLYAASTLYHTARSPRAKQVFRVVDHIAILLLIAGTYTPFTLVLLRGGWGWTLFGLVWGVAVAGTVFKIVSARRFGGFFTGVYLLMGWLFVFFLKPMLAALPMGALLWLLAGGLCYTIGVVFYVWERLPYSHAIWHLFVLGGSACHYFAVLLYVLPEG